MDGYIFEKQCAELLRTKGYRNVTVTKASGDQGVDIIAYKGAKKYAIQCKYYSSPVGNNAIQEVYAGAGYYDCTDCIVMTNSTFTKSAKDIANKLNVQLWENCSTSNSNGFLRKTMCIINVFFLILGIIVFIMAKQPKFSNATIYNYASSIFLIIASISSLLFWNIYFFNIVSSLFYLFFYILNFHNNFELSNMILLIPTLLCIIHAFLLKKSSKIS